MTRGTTKADPSRSGALATASAGSSAGSGSSSRMGVGSGIAWLVGRVPEVSSSASVAT